MTSSEPTMEELCRLLDGHRIPALALQLAAARDRASRANRRAEALAKRVSAWDTLNVFSDAASEVERDRARDEARRAREAATAAARAWEQALAPCRQNGVVDVVARVEELIEAALQDADVGRTVAASRRFRARALEVAAHVAARWFGDLDLATTLARLADDQARARASALAWEVAAPEGDWHLSAVDAEALEVRAALILLEPRRGFAALQASANEPRRTRELLEASAAARDEAVTLFDRLRPGAQAREQDAEEAAKRLAEDWIAHGDPRERVAAAIIEAVCHHPIVWLQLSLLAAGEIADAVEPHTAPRLQPDGQVEAVATLGQRGSLLAQLVEVRRAAEQAFPGIPHRLCPRGRAKRVATRRTDNSPSYRRSPQDEFVPSGAPEDPLAFRPREAADEAFFPYLEHGPLQPTLARAVALAQVRAVTRLELERQDVTVADRLAFWSTTADEATESTLKARLEDQAFKLQLLARHADELLATAATGAHPWAGLSHALAQAHTTVRTMGTVAYTSSQPIACPVIHREVVARWLDAVRLLLQRFFAVEGHRGRWAEDVCSRIASASGALQPPAVVASYADVVETLAAHLQPLGFGPLMYRLSQAAPEHQRATERKEHHAARVSWLDKLNVFTSTDDEELREQWRAHRDRLGDEVEELRSSAITMMTEALAQYPPLILLERVTAARYEVGGVRAELKHRTHTSKRTYTADRTRTTYYCRLRGRPAAIDAVRRLVEATVDVFGPLPTPDDVMEAWLRHRL